FAKLSGIIDWKSDRVAIKLSSSRCRHGVRFASGSNDNDNRRDESVFAETGALRHFGLTPEELQALPLDERICEEVSAVVAPCPPEESLAAYVIRVGVVEAGQQIIGAWIANRIRAL